MRTTHPRTGKTIDSCELCPLVYKGKSCQYRGHFPSCDKSFESCRERGNEERFGGQPNTEVNL
jgi:hypothetical protein